MQWRVYDRRTLAYIDGGYASEYTVDDDYIVSNNSSITLVRATSACVGDIVALIKTAGAYHHGVITAVDNAALTISYKSDKELFADNIPNPYFCDFGTGCSVAGRFGISVPAAIIRAAFSGTSDYRRNLPLSVTTVGDVLDESGNPGMLWTWSDRSISFCDWLVELFEKYGVVLEWTVDFDTASALSERRPIYCVTLSAVGKTGKLIKDNIAAAKITAIKEELPEKTVCIVLDSDETAYTVLGTYYLLQDGSGNYSVTSSPNSPYRVLPPRTSIITYDSSQTDADNAVTVEDAAKNELIPSKYSQSVEIEISKESRMFDFETARFGDDYAVITAAGRIDTVYSGRRENSESDTATLCFGVGRRRYTDQIQRRLRKQRYTVLYRKN